MIATSLDLLPADPRVVVAAVLVFAAMLGMVRMLLAHARQAPAGRARGWRTALLLIAQPSCAALLYMALFPPAVHTPSGTLLVATAGTKPAILASAPPAAVRVALPEAPASVGLPRVPDLATALRQHPGTHRVHVVGRGLEVRDRDAARDVALDLDLLPEPAGLVHLAAPTHAVAGREIVVEGRIGGIAGGRVELFDPGRQRVDRTAPGPDGHFLLTAPTRAPGPAGYRLEVRDATGRAVDTVAIPVLVETAPAPRVLVLAGAPGPELKYLRRWARDAGLDLATRIDAGGGTWIGDGPARLDAAALGRFDAVVLDERAWTALGESGRTALVAAVRDGLGVLLRFTATPTAAERARLRALGFGVAGDGAPVPARLDDRSGDADMLRARLGPGSADAPRGAEAPVIEAPVLARRALRLSAMDGVPLVLDRDGALLGLWRAVGRGRIGLWTVMDSYRLVLAGRDDLHGALWSGALTPLARARSASFTTITGDARPGERLVLCGLPSGARIVGPDGAVAHPLRDPTTGAPACAGFWPRASGWHRMEADGRAESFHVRARGEAPSLRAAAVREATLRLAAESGTRPAGEARPSTPRPGPRWPWWLAWLLLSAALWWFERARIGRLG